MTKSLLGLLILIAVVLAKFSYDQLLVEKSIGPTAVLGIALLGSSFAFVFVSYLLSRTSSSRTVTNMWLVITSITVTYVVVDVIAGLVLIEPQSPPIVRDKHRHHRLVPNSISEFHNQDFVYAQRVNNLGLRGRDQSQRKHAGTIRILMLGDSFTMGTGVDDGKTFSVLLEASMNHKSAECGGKTIEVLNAGVVSYAPILSYIQFKRDLLALNSDIVVLNFDMSDLVQEAAYRKVAVFSTNGDPIAVPQRELEDQPLSVKLGVWIEKHMYLTRLLLYYVNAIFDAKDLSLEDVVTKANLELLAHTLEGDSTPRDGQWRNVFNSILRIKELAEDNSMSFVLATYPWGHQVDESEWQPGRFDFIREGAIVSDASVQRIERFSSDNHVLLANLFELFRNYDGGKALYFPHDLHFTAAGHEVMALGLDHFLGETYLREWCN